MNSRRSGLALILVLTVIMALVVIATPFVLSMIMHEKTAVAERARRQAGYGAEGVRNFAVAQLYRGAEYFERLDLEQGKDGTPYMDDPPEFTVEIRDARLKDLKVRDPKGLLWGVTAQDEQGKINVTSAPERVCTNLRTNLSTRVVDLKDVLTIYSGRPARWVRPQKIREIGTITNPQDPTGTKMVGLRVDNAMQLGMGVKVRATRPGLPAFEAKVTRNGVYYIGVHALETDPAIPSKYLHGLLEIEMRHPVNLNTARRETLTALYEGLAIRIPNPSGGSFKTYTLSSEDARAVAEGLYKKRLFTWHEFLLETLNLSVDDVIRAAVVINAIDPGNLMLNDGAEGRGSLGFCFNSNETITVEALAAVNTEAGTPQGGAGFREVIDLGCPGQLTRSWENQHDFDRAMGPPRLMVSTTGVLPVLPKVMNEIVSFSGIFGTGYSGYPFGARIETFPKDLDKGEPSDMTLKSQQGKLANFISMRTERDLRGIGGIFRYIEHFDDMLEGKRIDKQSHSIEHGKVFSPTPLRADVSAGGTEFWIRFDQPPGSGAAVKLFDVRESDQTNRISIEIILNEIVFRITDATIGSPILTLDKGWSEIRAPFIPEKDTWYHVAAYWKGTKYGQMILMIDGFVPKKSKWRHVDTDTGLPMSTELSSPMAAPTDPVLPFSSVPLKDSSFIQKPATVAKEENWTCPLMVGDEVIEFDPAAGVGRRGARRADSVYGPQWQDHPQNAKVTVFGYTSPLRKWNVGILYRPPDFDPPGELVMQFGDLLSTRGVTSLRFGRPSDTYLVGEEQDPDGNPILGRTNDRIRFQIPDTVQVDATEWPDQGFLKLEGEAIFYERINRETLKTGYFEGCQRGMEGTMAFEHPSGYPMFLWSIAVDTLDIKIPTPTIIQVKEEWFGPVSRASQPPGVPKDFWVGCTVGGAAVPMSRGRQWMQAEVIHEAGEPMIPIFAAREVDTQVRRTNLQRWDPVTAINENNDRENQVVCRSLTIEELNQWIYLQNPAGGPPPPPPVDIAMQGVQLASLFNQVKSDFHVDGVQNRIIKWPSGELIGERWLALKNPSVEYGPARADLDEVKNVASLKGNFLLSRIAQPDVPQLGINNALLLNLNSSTPSGAIVVGEEIVGYATFKSTGSFERCKRGWLGSTSEIHNEGDPIFLLNFLPVAAVGPDSLAADGRMFPITQVLAGQGYTKGYILVNDEVVGFEEVGVKGVELDSLARFDGTGLFRGMFGTTARNHGAHSMVFGIPFRYWDGYKQGQFDNRMPYFQTAHTTRDARWREIRYSIETGHNDPNLLPHGYVRIDGLGDFTIPTVDEHSAVWHFFKSQQNPLQEYVSSRLENGQIEARFFLEYKQGSYWPEHSWKRTMKFHEVRIDYDRDTRVLLHEDK